MNSSRNGLTDYYHISLKKLSPHKIALYQRYFLSQTESDNKAKTQIKFQDKKFTSLKDVFKTPKEFLSPEKNLFYKILFLFRLNLIFFEIFIFELFSVHINF